MKKIAIQVPIKFKPSERIHNKNFIDLAGKPFYSWHLDRLSKAPKSWDIYIDSESDDVFKLINKKYKRFKFHKREKEYAENWANGNHLLQQFAILNPKYDIYCQSFITAVNLELETIKKAIEYFLKNNKNDSLFFVTKETGWVWYNNMPVNYKHNIPDGLPRSQDANYFKETTGFYMIKKDSLIKYGTRIGKNPIMYEIPESEAFDIDVQNDIIKIL